MSFQITDLTIDEAVNESSLSQINGGGGGTWSGGIVTQDIIPSGSLSLGSSSAEFTNIYFSGTIFGGPNTSIGTATNPIKDLHVSQGTIYVGSAPISSSGGSLVMPSGSTIGGVNPGTITILGALSDPSQLPTSGKIGDGYIISNLGLYNPGHLFVISALAPSVIWTDVGVIQGPQGIQGPAGPQGTAGSASNTGATGNVGPIGYTGPKGIPGSSTLTGATGPIGRTGYTGPQGIQGIQGNATNTGATGNVGPTGYTGPQGIPGNATNTGATGSSGPRGYPGPQGPPGYAFASNTGATGPYGYTGPPGIPGSSTLTGATGSKGPTGQAGQSSNTGAQGPTGPAGQPSNTGAQGPTGPAGQSSNTGATGSQGPTGPAGQSSNTGAQGPTGPVGQSSNTGATGSQGPTGSAGQSSNTGATGSQGPTGPAGQSSNTGAQGPTGPAGQSSNTGATGSQGPTGPAGQSSNTGATGSQGPTGPAGQSSNTGAQGPTGPAGQSSNTGAQGSTGSKGNTGSQGPTGPTGYQGYTGATGSRGDSGAQGSTGIGYNNVIANNYFSSQYGIQTWNVNQIGAFNIGDRVQITWPPVPTDFMQGLITAIDRVLLTITVNADVVSGPQNIPWSPWSFSIAGSQGLTGSEGPIGPTGSNGNTGSQGFTGPTGSQSPTGPTGFTGPIGIQGNTGAIGPTGPASTSGGSTNVITETFTIGCGPISSTTALGYSYDGKSWSISTSGSNLFQGQPVTSAWNGLIWIVAGQGPNCLIYSSDGITWNVSASATSIFGTNCRTIFWNGNIWVAGGSNVIAYSSDGITWTAGILNPSTSGYFAAISWNGSIWILGGHSGAAPYYSYDGIHWGQLSSIPIGNIYSIVWNGKIWIMGGQGNRLAYSYDGFIWNISSSGNNVFPSTVYSIAWNGSLWVAAGDYIGYSYDGINWTQSTSGSNLMQYPKSVCWNGSIWVAGGSGTNNIIYSSDGITWQGSSSGTSLFAAGGCNTTVSRLVLYNSVSAITSQTNLATQNFTVAGISGTGEYPILYSYDGLSWNISTTGTSLFKNYSIYNVAWNGSLWLICGYLNSSSNCILYSSDGINWQSSSSAISIFSGNVYSIAWNGSLWVAGGSSVIGYSVNGINWTAGVSSPLITGNIRSIAWNGQIWIAGIYSGNGGLFYSQDGIYWTSLPNSGTGNVNTIVWNGNMWIVGSYSGNRLVYSYDGMTWTPSSSGNNLYSGSVYQVAWNGSLWIAVGDSIISYSTDGINWTSITAANNILTYPYSVSWNGSIWIVGGNTTNYLIYSHDTVNWYPLNSANSLISTSCNCLGSRIPTISSVFSSSQTITQNFMIIGVNGNASNNLLYSYDGFKWNVSSSGSSLMTGIISSCVWNGYIWLVGQKSSAGANSIIYSSDGINWQVSSSAIGVFNGYVSSIASNGSIWVAGGTNKIAYSSDGINWTLGTASPTINGSVYSVAWNGSFWLAGIYSGTAGIYRSMDGIFWTKVLSPGSGNVNSIVWNGTMWLVGSYAGNRIVYSYDSITWNITSSANSLFPSAVSSIAWNGVMWVAVGDHFGYSYDGITWTNSSSGLALMANPISVNWNGSIWVAVGSNTNFVIYSVDGITWYENLLGNLLVPSTKVCNVVSSRISLINSVSLVSPASLTPTTQNFMIAGTNTGSTNNLLYSYNGLSWFSSTSGTSLLTYYITCAVWNGSIWLVSQRAPAASNCIIYSSDGINWQVSSSATSVFNGIVNWVAWNGSIWVAGGSSILGYSLNGITWTAAATNVGMNGSCYSIAWNGSLWIAVMYNGSYKAYTSKNGTYWTNIITPAGNANSIVWNGSLWVIGSYSGNKIVYSFDSINWNISTSGNAVFTTNVNSIGWNGYIWVAVGNNFGYSLDGINWNASTSGHTLMSSPNSVSWNGSIWVAVGNTPNYMIYSVDGINWTPVVSGITLIPNSGYYTCISSRIVLTQSVSLITPLQVITQTFTIACASNQTATILYSYDGNTWFESSSGSNLLITNVFSCAWNGLLWIIGGYRNSTSNCIIYSSDGINWNTSSTAITIFSGYVSSVAWNGNMWAAGGNNIIGYSVDGIKWKSGSVNTAITGNVTTLASNGSLWLAGINNGSAAMYYSINGIYWIQLPMLLSNAFSIVWNGSIWLAGGNGSKYICYSSDAFNWTESTSATTIFTSSVVYALGWNGSLWVAVGGYFAYSSDGINWTKSISGSSLMTNATTITWNGSMWIVGGSGGNYMVYSYDGINWQSSTQGNIILTTTCTYLSSRTVLVNAVPKSTSNNVNVYSSTFTVAGGSTNGSELIYSYDGLTWYPSNNGNSLFSPAQGVSAIAYNGSIWVASCSLVQSQPNATQVAYSTDGITWITAQTWGTGPFSYQCTCMIWNGKLFIAGDTINANMVYSYNGLQWARSPSSTATMLYSVRAVYWNSYCALAVGANNNGDNNYIQRSTDGVNWTTFIPSIFTNGGGSLWTVAWNGLYWLFGGATSNGFLFMSNTIDASGSWSLINLSSLPSVGLISSLCWNKSIWVMTVQGSGIPGYLAYSYDGKTWTQASSSKLVYTTTSQYPQSVTWNGNYWIVVGYGTQMVYSYDGVNWSLSTSANSIIGSNGYSITSAFQPLIGINTINNQNLNPAWKSTPQSQYMTLYNIPCVSGAFGSQGYVTYYSPDGINWVTTNTPMVNSCISVSWNGYIWVAGMGTNQPGIAYQNPSPNTIICHSYDGINWYQSNTSFVVSSNIQSQIVVYDIVWDYGNGIWIALIIDSIWISTDGINWTLRSSNNNITTITVGSSSVYGSTMLLGSSCYSSQGNQTYIVYSLNQGLTWTLCPTQPSHGSSTNGIVNIRTNGSVWVASLSYIDNNGGPYNQLWYSLDGFNWNNSANGDVIIPTASVNPTQGDSRFVNYFVWNGTVWVGNVQRQSLIYSYDGITWNNSVNNSNYAIQGLTYNGVNFIGTFGNYAYHPLACTPVAPYLSSSQLISYDGLNWSIASGISGPVNTTVIASKTPLPFVNPINSVLKYIPPIPGNWGSQQPNNLITAVNALAAEFQYGSGTTNGSGTLTVTFTTAYTAPPNVIATITGQTPGVITVDTITGTGFHVYTYNFLGASLASIPFNWQANYK
jgi:hypothetical protein